MNRYLKQNANIELDRYNSKKIIHTSYRIDRYNSKKIIHTSYRIYKT